MIVLSTHLILTYSAHIGIFNQIISRVIRLLSPLIIYPFLDFLPVMGMNQTIYGEDFFDIFGQILRFLSILSVIDWHYYGFIVDAVFVKVINLKQVSNVSLFRPLYHKKCIGCGHSMRNRCHIVHISELFMVYSSYGLISRVDNQ